MKFLNGQGRFTQQQVDYIFGVIRFVAAALQRPDAKVLVHCALAVWVNEIASLFQYWLAFTCLNS